MGTYEVTLEGRNWGWQRTRLYAKQGERISVQGSGKMTFSPFGGHPRDVAGRDDHGQVEVAPGGALVPGAPRNALVMRIGDGAPFFPGPFDASGKGRPFAAPSSGEIVIGANDDWHADNGGAWNLVFEGVSTDAGSTPPTPGGIVIPRSSFQPNTGARIKRQHPSQGQREYVEIVLVTSRQPAAHPALETRRFLVADVRANVPGQWLPLASSTNHAPRPVNPQQAFIPFGGPTVGSSTTGACFFPNAPLQVNAEFRVQLSSDRQPLMLEPGPGVHQGWLVLVAQRQ
jgi:hypothetical protein